MHRLIKGIVSFVVVVTVIMLILYLFVFKGCSQSRLLNNNVLTRPTKDDAETMVYLDDKMIDLQKKQAEQDIELQKKQVEQNIELQKQEDEYQDSRELKKLDVEKEKVKKHKILDLVTQDHSGSQYDI